MAKQIGPEAEQQFKWLEKLLKDNRKRKYIIITHMYAGARFKHNAKKTEQELFVDQWNERYFNLFKEHQDRVVIEVAGHDHWQDFRVFVDDDGVPYRNVFIPTGVSANHWQLPGFNTMKIDGKSRKPK